MDELNKTLLCETNQDNLNNVTEMMFENFKEPVDSIETSNVASFGTFTGIFIALLVDCLFALEYDKFGCPTVNIKLHKPMSANTLSRTIAMCILISAVPVVILTILLALVYKLVCMIIIKSKDKRCVGFLDSFDVFWSLEDDTSKSIITVLGFIESKSSEVVIDKIKEKLKTITHDSVHNKIFYRKTEDYGFYYWRRYSSIDIDQYVESFELLNGNDISMEDLEVAMTSISNQPLPYDEQGQFQIIVVKNAISNCEKAKGQIGIIFRIHHSLGDGMALLDFLRQTLADPNDESSFNLSSFPKTKKVHSKNSLIDLMDMIKKLLEIPVCFVDGIIRKPDESPLHGPVLTGKKIFKWISSEGNLLKRVRAIKNKANDLTFSEVLAIALSNGLQNYFEKIVTPIPQDVAVVLPVKCPNFSAMKKSKLVNDFSVTILDLPIQRHSDTIEIKKRCSALRKSADPITNYYFLKLVGYVLPKHILKPLLNSSQATMVFSNLPGPGTLTICGGYVLDSLVFFVPHKGTTGLGITALSYGGELRFAAMADTALISDSNHLGLILDGMVKEIDRLHQIYAK